MGQDPNSADDYRLRVVYENQIPIIYFFGIALGHYQAMLPTFISGWDATRLTAKVVFAMAERGQLVAPQDAVERRYALRVVKQRLHQAVFREAVNGL